MRLTLACTSATAHHLADLVTGVGLEVEVEVADGHLLGGRADFAHRAGDRARDEDRKAQPDEEGDGEQAEQQHDRLVGLRFGFPARLHGQVALEVDELGECVAVGNVGLPVLGEDLACALEVALLDLRFVGLLDADEGMACSFHLLEELLALAAVGQGFELLQALDDLLAFLGGLLQEALQGGVGLQRRDHHVPVLDAELVDRVDDFVGDRDLQVLVADQVRDVALQGLQPQAAHDRGDQQQQDHGKADAEASANFQVLHDVLQGNSVIRVGMLQVRAGTASARVAAPARCSSELAQR